MEKLTHNIGFIGAGNMTRAILGGLLQANMLRPPQAMVSDVSPLQLETIEQQMQPRIASDNCELVDFADIIVFAVKPFNIAQVCEDVAQHVTKEKLFVSICAGIATSLIEEKLGAESRVVRVMPNTPAMYGAGAAGIAAGSRATAEDLKLVRRIFEAVGTVVVLSEDKLDLVTGLTGSGPAYVFRFMEAMIESAIKQGLEPDAAEQLVRQTVYGAGKMAVEWNKPLREMREAVTTKGGTTEAGLKALDEGNFAALIHACVERATSRSRELSRG